ncbi:PrgI family protein (plasmid) [Finegoldia magna]|uniref:PrgI family protein n=1 Tax=Finegoldia magna TaxID=1260 RepID=UPI00370DDC3D
MIQVNIPRDISEYENKIFLNLTKRKLLALGSGLVLAILETVILSKFLKMSVIAYLIFLTVVPIAMIGFIKKDNLNMEDYLKKLYRGKFGVNKLTYKTSVNQDFYNMLNNTKRKRFVFKQDQMTQFDIKSGKLLDKDDYSQLLNNKVLVDKKEYNYVGLINHRKETVEYRKKIAEKYKKGKPKEEALFNIDERGELIGII